MSLNSNPKLESCIEACQRCAITCEHCSTACLNEDDVKMMVPCIMLDRSCAEMCALAAREMARGSMFANQTCRLCAEICQACGDECSKHQTTVMGSHGSFRFWPRGPSELERSRSRRAGQRPARARKTFYAPKFQSRSFIPRRRSAFEMTETDDKDMAAPAIIGLSRVPVKG